MYNVNSREHETYMKLTLILLEPIKISSDVPLDAICKKHTVMNIELDGELIYTNGKTEVKVTEISALCSSVNESKPFFYYRRSG